MQGPRVGLGISKVLPPNPVGDSEPGSHGEEERDEVLVVSACGACFIYRAEEPQAGREAGGVADADADVDAGPYLKLRV